MKGAQADQAVLTRDMDCWKLVDGKVADNRVMAGFPHGLAQPGTDRVNGKGRNRYDRCEKVPPRPAAAA